MLQNKLQNRLKNPFKTAVAEELETQGDRNTQAEAAELQETLYSEKSDAQDGYALPEDGSEEDIVFDESEESDEEHEFSEVDETIFYHTENENSEDSEFILEDGDGLIEEEIEENYVLDDADESLGEYDLPQYKKLTQKN